MLGLMAARAHADFDALDEFTADTACAIPLDEPLIEDDGGWEALFTGAVGVSFVTCIEPADTPSYLQEISAFLAPLDISLSLRWIVFVDSDGNGPPEGAPVWTSDPFGPAIPAFLSYDLSGEPEFDVPIAGGSWCVGLEFQTSGDSAVGA
ncbi:MAG: hypothetical protein M5R36_13925 [Deltaproteobacteria bacterium]|nr:hypothetical protein [Deltaproteobacteria bacterium]